MRATIIAGTGAELAGTGSWSGGADEPVLRLHARALVAVLGGGYRTATHDVLAEVLGHEARYWRSAARRAGLPAGEDPGSDAVLRQLAGVAALLGATDQEQLTALVRRVPLLADAGPAARERYAGWLSGLYPPSPDTGALGVVQPDLLAEALAVRVLSDCTPAQRSTIVAGLGFAQAVQALTVLGRACGHQPQADALIAPVLGADLPRMIEAVVQVAVQFPRRFTPRAVALLETDHLDWHRACSLAEEIPEFSLELSPLAAALTTRITGEFPPGTPPAVRARWIGTHAFRLATVGRRAEALAASQEAVDLRRELSAADRIAHLPDLAASVNNHALRLAESGRRVEALSVSREAVDLRRELAGTDRATHLPDLATSVSNHALRLAEAGAYAEALTLGQEAVDLCRDLAGIKREAYLPDLAASVTNNAALLARAGRHAEALAASEESVTLYQELAVANRDAYLPDFATAVNNHAVRLARGGGGTEVLTLSQMAVNLRRELAAANRAAYLPNLATSVNNHALRLAEAGRDAEALATGLEAVRLRRELAATSRDAYLPHLATSLRNVGYVGLISGLADETVLALTEEGLRYFDELAGREPAAFRDWRDGTTRILAALHEALDRRPD